MYKEVRNGNLDAFEVWLDQFEGEIPLSELWSNRKCTGVLRASIEIEDVSLLKRILDRTSSLLLQSEKKENNRRISPADPSAIRVLRVALRSHNEKAIEHIMSRADHLKDSDIFQLVEAALHARLDQTAIRFMGHSGCEIASAQPKKRRTATYLAVAIREKQLAVVRFLVLQKGIDPSGYDQNKGYPALCTAAQYNAIEIARFLLETETTKRHQKTQGKRATPPQGKRTTPAQIAHDRSHMDFLSAIFPESMSVESEEDLKWIKIVRLLVAARDGDLQAIQDILSQSDAPINPSGEGPTPLLLAVWENHTTVVEAILNTREADVDRRSSFGPKFTRVSPLSVAIGRQQTSLVLQLLAHSEQDLEEPHWLVVNGSEDVISIRRLAKYHGNPAIFQAVEDKIQKFKHSPQRPHTSNLDKEPTGSTQNDGIGSPLPLVQDFPQPAEVLPGFSGHLQPDPTPGESSAMNTPSAAPAEGSIKSDEDGRRTPTQEARDR